MSILKELWPIIVILFLIAICGTALCQRNYAIRRYEDAKIDIANWKTAYQFQVTRTETWIADYHTLAVRIVKLGEELQDCKALNIAKIDCIRKMADGYSIMELGMLEEIERLRELLDGQHSQSEARPGVAHPERPREVFEDTRMGRGRDARKRLSTRYPRLISLQNGIRRTMGRR